MGTARTGRDWDSFAALLREYRGAANLTQEQLAERAGLSVSSWRATGEERPAPPAGTRPRAGWCPNWSSHPGLVIEKQHVASPAVSLHRMRQLA